MNYIADFLIKNLGVWEILIRIAVACICGAFIGLERSHRQKEAGIRTHIILALGSALAMVVSKYGFYDIVGTGVNIDGSRVASNILTGIGFLGAGVIFIRSGSIKGLTTAAGVWTTAGIGITIGAGMYEIGLFATVLLVLIQIVLHRFLPASESVSTLDITMTIKNDGLTLEKIKGRFTNKNIYIQSMLIKKNTDMGKITVSLHIRSPHEITLDEMVKMINNDDNIYEISVS